VITTHAKRLALSTAILAVCTAGNALAEETAVHKALAPCIGMSNSADRLACYDKLAGRASEPTAIRPAPAAAALPAPAPSEEDFGRSRVQEAALSKAPPEIKTVTAKVAAFGRSPNLRTQITLDNGQIWEYQDDPDQLLSIGDVVTIRHGTLGSFLLVTPTKLSHRVRRIN
jgi:hypothetical protein